MILSNIKQFFNKKITNYLGFFLILFMFQYDTTFAAESELIDKIEFFSSWLLQWIGVLLGLATYLATMFLSPEWINGSIFWLDKYFKEVWILVSNIVYFVFAFVLIWIAFMNIIWKSDDQYQLKQALPKFIIWVILVPFSWFLVQFILSLSAILTVASLSLPFDTFPKHEAAFNDIMVPIECKLDLSSIWTDSSTTWTDWFISCKEDGKISVTELISNDSSAVDSIFWIISIYTYWILSFDAIDDVKNATWTKDTTKKLWDIIVKLLFDVLFVLIYAILIIALWFVLMIRWIYIWIYTMMSPVFWLMYFFDKKEWSWFFENFNVWQFIALAMVPVYTMLALSFGLLFIYVTWEWMVTKWTDSSQEVSLINDALKVWKFKLDIVWTVWSKIDSAGSFFHELWVWWLWVIWTLILKIFGIVVLWWTLMAAMWASKITKMVIEPLESFGKQVWWIVAKSPWNLPIFWWQSMKSMWNIAQKVGWHYDQKNVDRAWDFVGKHMKFIDWDGAKKVTALQWIDAQLKTLNWTNNPTSELLTEWKKLLKSMWNVDSIRNMTQSHSTIKDIAKKTWMSQPEIEKLNLTSKAWIVEAIKAIEWKFENYGSRTWAFDWKQLGSNIWANDVDKLIEGMSVVSDSSSNTNSQKNNVELNFSTDNPTKATLNLWSWNRPVDVSNWKVTNLGNQADELAKYISTNWYDKSNISELIDNNLQLDQSAKDQLDNFFWEKDWKIIFARWKTDWKDGYKKSKLNDFLK